MTETTQQKRDGDLCSRCRSPIPEGKADPQTARRMRATPEDDSGVGAPAKGSCDLCGEPFQDGETVIQIVEDTHPTYDREAVLHTYHEGCCRNRSQASHTCEHCGCMFYLALLQMGGNCRNTDGMLACPFCVRLFECNLAS